MDKQVYLAMAILEISRIVTYEIWYDYVKSNMEKKQK